MGVKNSGESRPIGSIVKTERPIMALFTTGLDPDWPDAADKQTGTAIYHGDQKQRRREWAIAVDTSGVATPARIYDLRSTFASNALAAGVTVFELARVMGTSVRMIERHYGTLLDGAHNVSPTDSMPSRPRGSRLRRPTPRRWRTCLRQRSAVTLERTLCEDCRVLREVVAE
jgi:hypothetical protein